MPRPIPFIILLLCSFSSFAQRDSVVELLGVEVQVRRFSLSGELLPVRLLDTSSVAMLTAASLSDMLNRESGVFVKNYGSGGIATLSMRGLGAAHTLLLWNGIPLNSPMLGLYDLTLVPVFLSGRMRIQQGGGGPLAGSGAVAGVIFIDNDLSHENGIRAEALAGTGSFGGRQLGAGIRTGNGKWMSATRIYHQSATNDFPFTAPEGVRKRQQHAAFRQQGFTQQVGYLHGIHQLEINLFGLQNDREIPPLMLSSVSLQEQEDQAIRGTLQWSAGFSRWYLKVCGGISHERIRYQDPLARLDDASRSTTLRGAAEALFPAGRQLQLHLQTEWLHARATASGYTLMRDQGQQSAAVKAVYRTNRVQVDAALRTGLFDGKAIPLLPALQLRIPVSRQFYLRGDISRVYRIPTLNDRFWQPGGNEFLVPEEGITGAAGGGWELERKKTTFRLSLNAFRSRLNRAIVWQPGSDGIYRAANIQSLLMYGGEAEGTFRFHSKNWKAGLSVLPVYTLSEVIDNNLPTAHDGGQMIYTPKILYRLQADAAFRQWGLRWYHQYTGYRYTTIDHSHYLEPFSLAEVVLSYDSHIRKSRTTFTLSVRNILDESYQAVAWRAMPGRSMQAGMFMELGGAGTLRSEERRKTTGR